MKVREFIKGNTDIDVYDNVCEELGIACCRPVELTEDGKKEFADVLDYDIEEYHDEYSDCAIVDIDGDNWEYRLARAKAFFEALAGYCTVDEWDKWIVD